MKSERTHIRVIPNNTRRTHIHARTHARSLTRPYVRRRPAPKFEYSKIPKQPDSRRTTIFIWPSEFEKVPQNLHGRATDRHKTSNSPKNIMFEKKKKPKKLKTPAAVYRKAERIYGQNRRSTQEERERQREREEKNYQREKRHNKQRNEKRKIVVDCGRAATDDDKYVYLRQRIP